MILGAILLGAELFAIDAQFYLVFLGVSAATVGLLGLVGIVMPEWGQWVVFSALALISMFTFRKSLYSKIRGDAKGFTQTMLGKSITVEDGVEAGAETRVEHRGSDWTALNTGDSDIAAGSRAKIVKVDGVVLHISAE